MAARRKVVKRGRKPGAANLWAQATLKGKPSASTHKLSDLACFVTETGKRYSGNATCDFAKEFVPVPGEYVNANEDLNGAKTRIGGQLRGGIEAAGLKGSVSVIGLEDDTVDGLTILAMARS